jgi:hypothetical protein
MEPEDREFMRELLLRHEKATDAMIKRLEDGSAESRARTADILGRTVANTEAIRAHTREFVAEMRAQRQALFRVLDRPEGGTGA